MLDKIYLTFGGVFYFAEAFRLYARFNIMIHTDLLEVQVELNYQQTVRRYFNIGQGGASSDVVLDAITLSKVL